MLNSEFRVEFHTPPWSLDLEIYISERRNGKTYLAKPVGMFAMEEVDGGCYNPEPTLRIAGPWRDAFLKAFAEALDDVNVKTENDFKLQGTIEALKAHMADLRKLLKLDK